MGTPTIIKGEEYFNTVIYEGNGGGQRVGRFVPFSDQTAVANSCIFNGATNNYLSRTASSNGSGTTLTFSCWVKRGLLGERDIMFTNDFSANGEVLQFDSSNRLYYYKVQSGWSYISNRTFEDTSKFYHILIARDTTNSSAGDRIKIYVDGDRITSFATETQPSINATGFWNQTTYSHTVGNSGNASYIRGIGYLAEVNMIDGQALLPASFGITDTSTGRWIPKAVEPHPTTTTDIAVTVVSSGGNKYALDGVTQGTVTLIEGATYKFDQSDSSNSGHPLRFSTTSDGTHGGGSEFTSGVTTVGTPGNSGAYTQIIVPTGTATLYYYCSVHSGMGGTANTQDQYGTNGFRLKFQDSSALGDDTSGNDNDFTSTNLASTDQTTDSPNQNFATLTPNRMKSGFTLSEGNLKLVSNTTDGLCMSGMRVSGGKFYIETEVDAFTNGGSQGIGFCEETLSTSTDPSGTADVFGIYSNQSDLSILRDGAYASDSGGALSAGDILQIAFDGSNLSNAKFYVGINNSKWYYEDMSENSSFSATRPTLTLDLRARTNLRFYVGNRASSGSPGSSTFICNFGQKSYSYTAPTGFGSFNQDALPETDKGISSFVWAKNRDNGNRGHQLYDSSRGPLLTLYSNGNNAESTNADSLQKFLRGGFSAEDFTGLNEASESHVAWNWVANKGTTASNTDGSITSTVQANTTAGFSIVQYTGTGSAATIGHGLSTAPTFIAVKNLNDSASWYVYMNATRANNANTYYMMFNSDDSQSDVGAVWNDTSPTSTVFSVGGEDSSNKSTKNFIAYCWTDVPGFSKIGQFSGNNNADGTFVYTNFKPSFVMVKGLSVGNGWAVWDSARSPINPVDKALFWNTSGTDDTGNTIDFLSNGFKLRSSDDAQNNGTYIYMAFAESPFVSSKGTPTTARF